MKVLAVDVDGVIAQSLVDWCGIYNARHGKAVKVDDITSYSLASLFSLTQREVLDIFSEVWSNYKHVPLMEPGLPDITKRLAEMGRVVVNTIRTEDTVEPVHSFLDINHIHYDEYKPVVINGTNYRRRKNGYDVIVDDNPTIPDVPGAFLRDQPWNRSVEFKNGMRARSLLEVVEFVKLNPSVAIPAACDGDGFADTIQSVPHLSGLHLDRVL